MQNCTEVQTQHQIIPNKHKIKTK